MCSILNKWLQKCPFSVWPIQRLDRFRKQKYRWKGIWWGCKTRCTQPGGRPSHIQKNSIWTIKVDLRRIASKCHFDTKIPPVVRIYAPVSIFTHSLWVTPLKSSECGQLKFYKSTVSRSSFTFKMNSIFSALNKDYIICFIIGGLIAMKTCATAHRYFLISSYWKSKSRNKTVGIWSEALEDEFPRHEMEFIYNGYCHSNSCLL